MCFLGILSHLIGGVSRTQSLLCLCVYFTALADPSLASGLQAVTMVVTYLRGFVDPVVQPGTKPLLLVNIYNDEQI